MASALYSCIARTCSSSGLPMSIRHDPPLGKTSNVVCTCTGPHDSVPSHTPVDGTNAPLAMRKVLIDGLSGERRLAIRWYAIVSMALIIAPLSTMARNRAFSPCGPCR